MLEFLPMHYGEMSCYTVCALSVMLSAGFLFTTIYIRYNSNEFRRVEGWVNKEIEIIKVAINGHDEYIDTTTGIINKIHIDMAIQKTSMKDIKDDIAEIKADLKKLLERAMEK